jgi:ABC-type polysaccharide/polyol phosphate export permease
MAFRTEALKRIEGFDEALDTGPPLPGGGDLDAFYRVMMAGYHHIYEPSALVRHRHRRSRRELCSQLAGHHRSLTAFLVKTVGAEKGLNKCAIAAFLAWRLAKPLYRLVTRLLRRDPLPVTFLSSIALASFAGLGSYHASKQRSMTLSRVSGGCPPRVFSQLSELRSYRELVWNLTARDLKVKYQRSWLGFLWTLLNPLITVTVLVGVFSYVVRLPIEHYWAFLISGYFVWNFFSQTLNGGVQAAVGNAYLTRSSYFPQEVLVLSSALARFIEFIFELTIVMLLLAVFHHGRVPLSFLMALPILPILFLLAVGVSFPLVNLAVYYHDAIQAIPLVTLLLFYVSPVFYSVEFVPEGVRTIYMLNPVAALLTLCQDVFYSGKMPSLMVLFFLGGLAFFTYFLGYSVFNRNKRQFAEIV